MEGERRRVGVFGGSFDPVHNGHLTVASAARDRLGLDLLYIVPARLSPHKTRTHASDEHRVAMLRRAFRGVSGCRVSRVELDRKGRSYTVETLRRLGARHPDARLYLVVGGDAAANFEKWRNPEDIHRLATLVAVERPGFDLPEKPRFIRLSAPLLDISLSDIRRRCWSGRPIDGFTPPAVIRYIARHQLYG